MSSGRKNKAKRNIKKRYGRGKAIHNRQYREKKPTNNESRNKDQSEE